VQRYGASQVSALHRLNEGNARERQGPVRNSDHPARELEPVASIDGFLSMRRQMVAPALDDRLRRHARDQRGPCRWAGTRVCNEHHGLQIVPSPALRSEFPAHDLDHDARSGAALEDPAALFIANASSPSRSTSRGMRSMVTPGHSAGSLRGFGTRRVCSVICCSARPRARPAGVSLSELRPSHRERELGFICRTRSVLNPDETAVEPLFS
jgi:hypothetical protein